MEGFFSKESTQSKSRPEGKKISCASCGLYRNCTTPKMQPSGNFRKGILNIGSFNSELDDKKGTQWQGPSGRLLKQTYEKLGIDLFEDCLNINAINCFPGDDEKINSQLVINCRKSLLQLIDEYHPNVIVLFGIQAIESIIGTRWKKDLGDMQKWRGWTIPDQEWKAWICPVFHPSDIDFKKKEVQTIWEQDLERVVSMVDIPIPKYKEPVIEVIEDLERLWEIKSDSISFDYECTGIKPHAKGHRIVCCAVANTSDHAFVFMMPTSKSKRKPFTDLLENKLIGKICTNFKYELAWTKTRLKCDVKNWMFDTMLAAHLLDNRPGITSLKFQAFVQFGVGDYSSELDQWLHTGDKDGNAKNRIFELIKTNEGIDKLLTYCALDSIYTYRLFEIQAKQMNFSYLPF